MNLCRYILATFFILSLSNCGDSKPKPSPQAHIYLATKFGGHHVSIAIDGDTLFAGRALSDDVIGLAAMVVARPTSQSFKLEIKVDSPATGPLAISEAVDLSKGTYFIIFLSGTNLNVQQDLYRPDFY